MVKKLKVFEKSTIIQPYEYLITCCRVIKVIYKRQIWILRIKQHNLKQNLTHSGEQIFEVALVSISFQYPPHNSVRNSVPEQQPIMFAYNTLTNKKTAKKNLKITVEED